MNIYYVLFLVIMAALASPAFVKTGILPFFLIAEIALFVVACSFINVWWVLTISIACEIVFVHETMYNYGLEKPVKKIKTKETMDISWLQMNEKQIPFEIISEPHYLIKRVAAFVLAISIPVVCTVALIFLCYIRKFN